MENITIFEEALKNYVESKKNDRCYYLDSDKVNYLTLFNFLFTDSVLCNDIVKIDNELIYNNLIDETLEDDDEYPEFYQFYIVNIDTWRLEKYQEYLQTKKVDCNISLFHSDVLDVDVVGVSHYGTGWSCVPTSIELERDASNE